MASYLLRVLSCRGRWREVDNGNDIEIDDATTTKSTTTTPTSTTKGGELVVHVLLYGIVSRRVFSRDSNVLCVGMSRGKWRQGGDDDDINIFIGDGKSNDTEARGGRSGGFVVDDNAREGRNENAIEQRVAEAEGNGGRRNDGGEAEARGEGGGGGF